MIRKLTYQTVSPCSAAAAIRSSVRCKSSLKYSQFSPSLLYSPFDNNTRRVHCQPNHNVFSLKQFTLIQTRHFSSPASKIEEYYRHGEDTNANTRMCLTSTLDENDPLSHEIYRYEIDFKAECADIQFAQEGAFIELSKKEVDRIFPTGMAGELQGNAFMVRDSSKLLCRLLEDFESRCKFSTGVASLPLGTRYPVVLPDLTNANEWDNAATKVFSYSNDNLNTIVNRPQTADGEKMIVRGEGSVVESVVQKLREKSKGDLPARVILTGKRGTGKSCALNHAVYHARSRGWICILIPNGWHHVNGGAFIEPVDEVTGVPELYDNTMMSADLLRNFWKAHKEDIKKIPLKFPEKAERYRPSIEVMQEAVVRTYGSMKKSGLTFTEVRQTEVGFDDTFPDEDALDDPIINNINNFNISDFKINNLEDLVLFGIAFRDFAGPVVLDLVHELRNYKNPDKPILVAIDQYNYWDMPTVYQYENKKIDAMNLCVPYALKFVSQKKNVISDWEGNGDDYVFCIGATSYRYPINKKRDKKLVTYENSRSSLPLSIDIGGYTHVEFLGAVKHYLATGRIDHGISNQDILSFRMFCGNNPRTMFREPSNFFLPLQSDYVSDVFQRITSAGGGGGAETYKSMQRDYEEEQDPEDDERTFSREDSRYGVKYEEELSRAGSNSEFDVDLSKMNPNEVEKYLTDLATEPVWDVLEMTDSNPLVSRVQDVDIKFGGKYDELLRKSGD